VPWSTKLFDPIALPKPTRGMEWKLVIAFRPAEKLMEDAG
jgi:hypothetical protein